jgi:hypothetical protein
VGGGNDEGSKREPETSQSAKLQVLVPCHSRETSGRMTLRVASGQKGCECGACLAWQHTRTHSNAHSNVRAGGEAPGCGEARRRCCAVRAVKRTHPLSGASSVP